jgi:hypothetical protein
VMRAFDKMVKEEDTTRATKVNELIVGCATGTLEGGLFDWDYDAVEDIARKLVDSKRSKAQRLHEALGDALQITPAKAGENKTMVDLELIIKKFVPLLEEIKSLSNTHPAQLETIPTFLVTLVSKGRLIIDGWASGDESVRRVRGHVVPPKAPAEEERNP